MGLIDKLSADKVEKLTLQQYSPEEIEECIRNNKIIDFSYGNAQLLTAEEIESLFALTEAELKLKVEEAKKHSLLEVALEITPNCNAHCPICYTNAGVAVYDNNRLLSVEVVKELFSQAAKLGAKSLFIAGLGEPTLDPRLFEILDCAGRYGLQSYLFVNGITLSNDDEAKKYCGYDALTLTRKIKEAGSYIAPKLWAITPNLFERLTGTRGKYKFTDRNGYQIPKVFENIGVVGFDPQKVIINLAVTQQNFSEVDEVLSFCIDRGYKLFMEEFVLVGRGKMKESLSLTAEQKAYIFPLTPKICIKPKIQVVISPEGYLMECKGIRSEEKEANRVIDANGHLKDLFSLRHSLSELVGVKYKCHGIERYCENANQAENGRRLRPEEKRCGRSDGDGEKEIILITLHPN